MWIWNEGRVNKAHIMGPWHLTSPTEVASRLTILSWGTATTLCPLISMILWPTLTPPRSAMPPRNKLQIWNMRNGFNIAVHHECADWPLRSGRWSPAGTWCRAAWSWPRPPGDTRRRSASPRSCSCNSEICCLLPTPSKLWVRSFTVIRFGCSNF